MPGVVVDGNDVLAVEQAAQEAVELARRGEGPTLIECKTYRLCGHSRSDACNYRSREEEAEWQEKDPLSRLSRHLVGQNGAAVEVELERIEREVVQLIDEAVAFAESSPSPRPEDALLHVFWEEA
jgi:pyruvate dehydrogenase E1 component alpha subunit